MVTPSLALSLLVKSKYISVKSVYEDVDTKYAAYCCDDQNCDYIAHL